MATTTISEGVEQLAPGGLTSTRHELVRSVIQ